MSNLVACMRCGHANPAQVQFCEKCSSPLMLAQQNNDVSQKSSGLKLLAIFGSIGCGGLIVLIILLGSLERIAIGFTEKNQRESRE
jgi:hypothetical protein